MAPVPERGTVIAIHQPNFFPWLGYFDKVIRCDAFVVLDTVQFPKKGGTWINRVKVLMNGEARWVTAPVDRSYHGYKDIAEMRFDERQPWRENLLNTLAVCYRRAPRFSEAMSILSPLILNPQASIASYNGQAIESLLGVLGVPSSKLRLASSMPVTGASNELLIGLTRRMGGSIYMCGGGSGGYQDDTLFAQAGFTVARQDFQHPLYEQFNSTQFVPGLSIIDPLMNVGVNGLKSLLGIV